MGIRRHTVNNTKKIIGIIAVDKLLMLIAVGIILCGLALIGMVVTAGVLYS